MPLLRAFAMVTMTLERAYARLRDQDVISPQTGELRTSLDVIGRLSAHQARLAAQLGLSPVSLQALKHPATDDDLASALARGK